MYACLAVPLKVFLKSGENEVNDFNWVAVGENVDLTCIAIGVHAQIQIHMTVDAGYPPITLQSQTFPLNGSTPGSKATTRHRFLEKIENISCIATVTNRSPIQWKYYKDASFYTYGKIPPNLRGS